MLVHNSALKHGIDTADAIHAAEHSIWPLLIDAQAVATCKRAFLGAVGTAVICPPRATIPRRRASPATILERLT